MDDIKEGTIDDFLFEIEFSVQPNVYINIVEGPFCTGKNEDKCGSELVEEKTLFGNYKYRCERCGKVQKSKLSSWSLQKRAERIATAEIKRKRKLASSTMISGDTKLIVFLFLIKTFLKIKNL